MVTSVGLTPPTTSRWDEPDGVEARGTVLVLGGRGDTTAAYARFGRRLSADAYRVRAVADVTAPRFRAVDVARSLLREGGARPFVVLGVDAGALLALRLAATTPDGIDGVITVGLPRLLGPVPAGLPQLPLRTRSPEHWATLADPLVVDPAGLSRPIPDSLTAPEASAVRVPVLGVHGEDDSVEPVAAALDYYTLLPEARVVVVDRGRHDSLNDASHRSVAASIVLFLEELRNGTPTVAEVPLTEGTPS
jgi:alpha-beta hydrolase superfamily lysophospholipase